MDASPTELPLEAATGAKNARARGSKTWVTLGMALLMALPCLRIPQTSLGTELDDSWSGVLIYAHEKGLQFGPDIAFTYGPLGFLSVENFSPAVAWPRMLFEGLISFTVAVGLCFLAWRMKLAWRVVSLGFFLLVVGPIHSGGDELLLDLGLFTWGWLCWLESGRRLTRFAFCLAGLAAVCALVKFTLLVTGGMTIALSSCDLALRGRRRLAVGMVTAFVFGWMAGWMLLGQGWSNMGDYLRNSVAISAGYNLVMGQDNYSWTGGLVLTALALAAVALRVTGASLPDGRRPGLRRGLLIVWLAGLIFLAWKHGFVRAAHGHVSCFIGFMAMVALALAAAPMSAPKLAFWERVTAAGCALLAVFLLSDMTAGFLADACRLTGERVTQNIASLLKPAGYVREKSNAYALEQSASQLPELRRLMGHATVDVFGQNQMFALFNELNYRPRPVFQSYSAYNRELMELNRRFYDSTNAPEFVLFSLKAIDKRFPPLEDALVLRDVLINYALAGAEGDFILLRRRPAAATPAILMTLVREADVEPGAMIDLTEFGNDNLWLEINVTPSLPGRWRSFFFKPAALQLDVWKAGRSSPDKRFHAPMSMLAAGFLASPLELNNQDVAGLYEGKTPARPSAYSIEFPPGTANFWLAKIHCRIYRLGNRLGG